MSDNVFVCSGGWQSYYHTGTNWKKSGSGSNQNFTIIYPDEGVFISRIGPSAVDLVTTGTVPTTTERTDVDGLASTFVSNRFPVDVTLSSVGFQTLPGWVSGTNVNNSDNVYIYNTGWQTYYYNGTIWKKSGSGVDQGSTTIPAGSAVFVRRTTAGSSTLTQNTPYTP